MSILLLNRLSLRNFKGCKSFELVVNGRNAKTYGDNATGKTTLFDAFSYLFFDKDSQNKSNFQIKTLDENNNVIPGLEHEVEAEFNINGEYLKLKKVFAEKWTKKRGQAIAEFTGHTTTYFIDDVPVKKKEYEAKIESIMSEDIFKLLTSPTYFNEQLHWQKRREILLSIAGDVTDNEVISSSSKLSALPSILNGKSIEDYRKIIASRRKKINDELEKIPVRIDEIRRNLPDTNGLDKSALEQQVTALNNEIDELMTNINSIKNGKAISDIQQSIQKIDMELLEIKRDNESDSKEKIYQLKSRIQEETSNISILNSKINNQKQLKSSKEYSIKSLEEELNNLRQDWTVINKLEFTHEDACVCPTCKQDLPVEQVEEVRNKALAAFNSDKSNRIEKIDKEGKSKKERVDVLENEIANINGEIEKIEKQVGEKETFLKGLKEQLKQLESTVTDVFDNPTYVEKLKEKQSLEGQIKAIREDANKQIQSIQMEILDKKEQRDQIQNKIGQLANIDAQNKRIEELMQEERNLAAEFEELEGNLYLTEEFIRLKVTMLEERINSKFKYARFKLFETQVNGGLQEVCETTFNGVPYSSGLNNAARINVGLDIINTLSEHYEFMAPIFIDNAEAVTKLIDTKAQTIALIVSEQDKELRVEIEDDSDLIPVNVKVV
ncbi:ATPase involved in DNA repair [Niallia circulans]|uniref:AAA family ATPase n=1 Tax=Niallia circulans TaxID=1397 RepID=UPI00077C45B9|nr:AAA family ATPase [Niallia circulans]MED3839771.1 AAA family ATPase [Niallia circulans]MED4241257.1 AAA family ATPase [Niallia circulans]MED4247918.1 AAA family ATPase [Niallia circulans]QKH61603.1 AAA family ATPase [Niallia circulans]SPU11030.1 ATPase involved in DNA repair [Niallia circulans]